MKSFFLTKTIFLVVAVLSVTALAGCASTPTQDPNLPPWINDFPPPGADYLWGVGHAKQSSESLSMTVAEGRARVAIARQLDTLVQAALINHQRDAGTVGSQASTSLQQDVSRQITNRQLTGAEPNQRWKAPDGTWWYRVQYPKDNARREAAAIFDSEAARYAEFKADEALRYLDDQLARNERPLVVSED